MFAINITTFTLLVRAVRATLTNAFINADAEPSESFIDIVFGSWYEALRVSIFDT
jgi:hypothetical protein